MALTKNTDHVKTALKRLLSKEKGHDIFRAWVKSYVARVQELENTAWDVLEKRTLDGEGAQLDAIGRLVVRYRGDLDDDNYKIALRAQIRVLRSKGQPRDLEDVATLSLPIGFDYRYDEDYPKSTTIEVVGAVDFDIDVLWYNLVRAKPAGTRLWLIWGETTTTNEFSFCGGTAEEEDAANGFSDDSELNATGGALANVYGS